MNGPELRAVREAHAWTTDQVAQAVYRTAAGIRMMELGKRPIAPDVAAWAEHLPPMPPPLPDGYSPDTEGLRAWLADNGLAPWAAGPLLRVTSVTLYRWLEGTHPPSRVVAAWLERGAPADWWPPDPPVIGQDAVSLLPAAGCSASEWPNTKKPGSSWVWLPRQGWAPPGGWCHEGRDYGRVLGCRQCCWRTECREIARLAS